MRRRFISARIIRNSKAVSFIAFRALHDIERTIAAIHHEILLLKAPRFRSANSGDIVPEIEDPPPCPIVFALQTPGQNRTGRRNTSLGNVIPRFLVRALAGEYLVMTVIPGFGRYAGKIRRRAAIRPETLSTDTFAVSPKARGKPMQSDPKSGMSVFTNRHCPASE
ncbi:hypothetical protein [Rhodovulum viride]|uniref:hypothetical protein n=1 Tax=Rhodovulum viride TaxID=1231134 RepID=UPI0015EC8840|nr:hypothetical protein [Rhodovulum viride]